MKINMAHLPDSTDVPAHNLHDSGTAVLYLDRQHGNSAILLGHRPTEEAIAYLDALIAEASALRAKLQEAHA